LGNSGAGFPACAQKKGDPPGRPAFYPIFTSKFYTPDVQSADIVISFNRKPKTENGIIPPTVLPVLASLRLP